MTEERFTKVRITNGLDFAFTDRYDGVPFTLLPGKTDTLPLDMAEHFFAFSSGDPEKMFRHTARRQGWNNPKHLEPDPDEPKKTLARAMFDKLKIEPVAYKVVEDDNPDPRTPIAADSDLVARAPGFPTRRPPPPKPRITPPEAPA